MKKAKKALCLGLLVLVGIVAWDVFLTSSTPELFLKLWSEDLQQLKADQKLPSEFEDLRELDVQTLNQEAKDILAEITLPFQTREDGQYILEILMDVWTEEEKRGVFLRYDLVAPDGNTVWELSRTILLPENQSVILSWLSDLM